MLSGQRGVLGAYRALSIYWSGSEGNDMSRPLCLINQVLHTGRSRIVLYLSGSTFPNLRASKSLTGAPDASR